MKRVLAGKTEYKKKEYGKLLLMILCILLVGCFSACDVSELGFISEKNDAESISIVEKIAVTPTNTPTPMPTATNTPTPTSTPTSTNTPTPTATNTPTPTNTPTNTPSPTPTKDPEFVAAEDYIEAQSEKISAEHHYKFETDNKNGIKAYIDSYVYVIEDQESEADASAKLPQHYRGMVLARPDYDDKQLADEVNLYVGFVKSRLEAYLKQSEEADELIGAKCDFVRYSNGIYETVIFEGSVTDKEGNDKVIYTADPVMFSIGTGERVWATDILYETAYLVAKDRLMKYIKSEEIEYGDGFMTEFTLNQSDFHNFFFINKEAVFRVRTSDLDGVKLEGDYIDFVFGTVADIEPYMRVTCDGAVNDSEIRMDLDRNRPMIAFTFDDGPVYSYGKRLVELFQKYEGKCTFFVLGSKMKESSKELFEMELAAGDEIATHTYKHFYTHKAGVTKEDVWNNIVKGVTSVAETAGRTPKYLRMPGGGYSPYQDYILSTFPLLNVNWGIDSNDWRTKNKDAVQRDIRAELKGDNQIVLVLVHEIHKTTIEAMEELIPQLYEEGYQFVTVSEFMYYKGLDTTPGKLYKGSALK